MYNVTTACLWAILRQCMWQAHEHSVLHSCLSCMNPVLCSLPETQPGFGHLVQILQNIQHQTRTSCRLLLAPWKIGQLQMHQNQLSAPVRCTRFPVTNFKAGKANSVCAREHSIMLSVGVFSQHSQAMIHDKAAFAEGLASCRIIP